jgi:hypothetical protein
MFITKLVENGFGGSVCKRIGEEFFKFTLKEVSIGTTPFVKQALLPTSF